MKNKLLTTLSLFIISLFSISCSSWVRIGDLNAISNRNIEDGKTYVLLNREVEATADNNQDALEQAIDMLTKKYEGEFLRNTKIFVKDNGKEVKIIGDVWGIQNTKVNVTTQVNVDTILNVGDHVIFKRKGELTDGKIVGINSNMVIIEYGKAKKIELKYDEVTKSENHKNQ